ncbi:MAG: UDP-N-acetylglucosamine--N-acetylmuramyl-(pentapeptide) pyrophosphoryl-undecaprenol N-acetylglucosamine transferase [Deferribacteraceae bacterium]|jgi:UDP-N-acetylglucosamine--N-acetylmuramyl-(pentapeptide) pyrophosphoryl-undecaprenol N-acetylglucosamine transferase|nr:UDP-N-acetylglucosamine--N-acetylmuramyl-(pentapeptide) pyrophosphoryl-undecaprenol N-acetylglucosamine transferase [Deferribacteraceae bacterium]
MKVILAGGGTGGHLYPGIAVAQRLVQEFVKPFFLVSDRGIEARVLSQLGYEFIEQKATPFMGVGVLSKAKTLAGLMPAAGAIAQYIDKGDKILLLGGFASAPAAIAGMMKGADIYIHEQNSVMGLVNRLMSSQSRRIFLSYPRTKGATSRSLIVGNPVRKELMDGKLKTEQGKQILVLGGSGGSRIINTTFAESAESLMKAGYTIRHQTGEKMYDETVAAYERNVDSTDKRLQIEPYIDDMAQAYREADLVVARSGSGTVFETMYAKRAALYIPFAKAAENHQYMNALSVKELGYADILEEKDLNKESLLAAVNGIFSGMAAYRNRLAEVQPKDTAELILKGMGIL